MIILTLKSSNTVYLLITKALTYKYSWIEECIITEIGGYCCVYSTKCHWKSIETYLHLCTFKFDNKNSSNFLIFCLHNYFFIHIKYLCNSTPHVLYICLRYPRSSTSFLFIYYIFIDWFAKDQFRNYMMTNDITMYYNKESWSI